jgi:hypothetical protein
MRVAEAGAGRGVRSRTGVIIFVSVLTVRGVLNDDLVLDLVSILVQQYCYALIGYPMKA